MTPLGRRIAYAALLALLALALYAPVRSLPFLGYDDEQYVTANKEVQKGLTPEGMRWALTSFTASNWHPLTWVSHMLDVSLFGQSPEGPHVENAILHALNSALVFAVTARLTGATGRSALAALLWAVHPQHVESVAWVAERKDLLSTLFGLLALLAWPSWTRDDRRGAYAAALVCAALGLLAKPMLVSLPLLLLVLDFWPLARGVSARIFLEKLPFVALSVGSSLVTMQAQVFAMQLHVSFGERLANACIAYAATLAQTFAPVGLAALYPHPHPGQWPAWEVALAAAALAALAALAIALRRRAPYLLAGGLWYAIALGPTVGLVQVGFQSHADRYAYLPHIGVAWAVVFGAADLLGRLRAPAVLAPALAFAAALVFGLVTRQQLPYWESNVALWQRTVEVARPSYYAETELGIELGAVGRFDEALPHLARAVALNPLWPRGQASYGFALFLTGDTPGAIDRFERAFAIEPNPGASTEWHLYYARALADAGRLDEAARHYEKQLAGDPNDPGALLGLAEVLATAPPPLRDGPRALELAQRGCEIARCSRPIEIDILAMSLAAAGEPANAARLIEEALRRADVLHDSSVVPRLQEHLARFRAGESVTRK